MTVEMVLKNLKKLIGTEFNYDEVICAFEDYEENGETSVIVNESSNAGYDYIAYIDTVGGVQFLFTVDEDDFITKVWMYEED